MVEQVLKFCCDQIEMKKFHSSKNLVDIYNVRIDKIIIPDPSLYGKNKKLFLILQG